MNEDEIKTKVGDAAYRVLREGGTEAPFSGAYYKEHARGMYNCKVCNTPLFSSEQKYDSDTVGLEGWPSFNDALPGAIEYRDDMSMGVHRLEVICAKCKSHLGHIFDDADSKTGKHYCINSVCLDLEKNK